MTRRPTPVHRSITPAHMKALRDPASTDFRRQRWHLHRARLIRRLLFATIVMAAAVLLRLLLVAPGTAPADDEASPVAPSQASDLTASDEP